MEKSCCGHDSMSQAVLELHQATDNRSTVLFHKLFILSFFSHPRLRGMLFSMVIYYSFMGGSQKTCTNV